MYYKPPKGSHKKNYKCESSGGTFLPRLVKSTSGALLAAINQMPSISSMADISLLKFHFTSLLYLKKNSISKCLSVYELWDKVFVCEIDIYLGLIFKYLTGGRKVLLEM